MPLAAEAAVAMYLYAADVAMTAPSSRLFWRELPLPAYGGPSSSTLGSTRGFEDDTSLFRDSEESERTGADETVAQLYRFERLSTNWDGNGAAAPIPDSIHDAKRFIRRLSPESIIPIPALHADGHATLLLVRPDLYAELECLGGDRIGYYVKRDGGEWGDEFSLSAAELPAELSEIGFAIES